MTTLALLAHQDDEIGVLHTFATCVRAGEPVVCAYLTNGAWGGVTSATRNGESLKVLGAVGVPAARVEFPGERLWIGDGVLVEHLEAALSGLTEIAERVGPVTRILMHAWEGGHQDHDAGHLVGRVLARALGIEAQSRQFMLYRPSPDGKTMLYAAPDPDDGPIETTAIPRRDGIAYAALLRHYRSQWRVLARLGPKVVRGWVVDQQQKLQMLPPVARLEERPAPGTLLYERWGLYDYSRFRVHAAPFVARLLDGDAGSMKRAARG